MPDRYKFFEDVWNTEQQHYQKGFPTVVLSELFDLTDNITYRIPIEYTYRPDLLANKFYRDPGLSWVLVYANNFSNSPEDFALGALIKVPRFERVMSRV